MSQIPGRFTALDIFRGMTVCFMIIVNTPGDGSSTFAPLQHASWHGFTPTDLVFPSFLFAVGNALSFVSQKWSQLPASTVWGRILKRTLIIFLLGYLMYWFPFVHFNEQNQLVTNPISHTRIMGVLQRIALCYFFTSLLIYYFKPRQVFNISVLLLIGYWLLLLIGGTGNDPYDMVSNAGSRLDRWLMGSDHLYHGEGVAFDPEGLLSTLPAIVNVTFGYLAGSWIMKKGNDYEGLAKLLMAGVILVALSLAWHPFFPINKKLWTGSFVLLTTGIDCVLLAVLIYITDFLRIRRWGYFFEVFGKNALFIYLLSEIGAILLWFFSVDKQPLYRWVYNILFKIPGAGHVGSLLFALVFMMVCWLMGYILDKRKIYIRV